MDWKKAARIFCGTVMVPSVEGLFHSRIRVRTVPTASRAPVVISTSLVYTLHFFAFRSRITSSQTRKPRPPRMTRALNVSQITGSVR